jgi:predicted DNA-binding transcriptional regulator AlpA
MMGFVRLPILTKLLGVSKTTIYKEIREGRFPKQIRLSPRVSAWRIREIKAHLEQLTHDRAK